MESTFNLDSLIHFQSNLKEKELIIIKFTASWCVPCQGIKPIVDEFLKDLPESIKFIEIDVDESIELYSLLKTKKMLNGIPAIMAYNSEAKEHVYIPYDSVLGGSKNEVKKFFDRCITYVS